MNLKYSRPSLRVKLLDDSAGNGGLSGYASDFVPEPDAVGDVIMQGAFGNVAFEVPMLAYHDMTMPCGGWTLTPDDYGLKADGIFANTQFAQDMREYVRVGGVPALSIGYNINASEPNEYGGLNMYRVDVKEVSLVPVPANSRAVVTAVKCLGLDDATKSAAAAIVKAGRRNSGGDQEALNAAHDWLIKAGSDCSGGMIGGDALGVPADEGTEDEGKSLLALQAAVLLELAECDLLELEA